MTWVCCAFGNVYICSSYQRGMRPILHHIDISSTLQRTEVIFMENIQSAKVTNPTIIRQRDLPYVVKIKYSCAIFQPHENNGCQEEKRRFQSVAPSNSARLSIKQNREKQNQLTHALRGKCSYRGQRHRRGWIHVKRLGRSFHFNCSWPAVKSEVVDFKGSVGASSRVGVDVKGNDGSLGFVTNDDSKSPSFWKLQLSRMLDVFLLIEDDCNVF